MENGVKRKATLSGSSPKRIKLLGDDSGDEDAELELKVNHEYAKRFEHNKQRAELHMRKCKYLLLSPGSNFRTVEERYGKNLKVAESESDDSSSEDGTEDDLGELADERTDAEIAATLDAIRSKDPRIYQKDVRFFSEDSPGNAAPKQPTEKPMFLRDYHRKNLLENAGNGEPVEDSDKLPYVFEQEALKKALVDEIHKPGEEDDDNDFLVRKERQPKALEVEPLPIPDVSTADQDPEGFLSKFFSARAWVPTDSSTIKPLESDDEEDERKAEEFENAWNLRFEDPEASNQSLITHSRAIVEKYSVRREEGTGRKRAREREKEKKRDEKKERQEQRSRLKTLKIKEMTAKMEKIRDAAGLDDTIKAEDWADLLDGDWDDERWNSEMTRRFGRDYDQKNDDEIEDLVDATGKSEKPKWDDDIDIKDLVPDFNEDDMPEIELNDDEPEASAKPAPSKSDRRRDRRIIEALAEQSMPLEMAGSSSEQAFRYRETSPNSFGLTPLDILGASDAQLNQFAGLKKLATFRNEEWKRRDKKKLGKKARLRMWRRETFGRDEPPSPETIFAAEPDEGNGAGKHGVGSGRRGKKKRKAQSGIKTEA
jgi:protein KRI1